MQFKKLILTLSTLISANVLADDKIVTDNNISYDWSEISYGTDINNSTTSTFKSVDTMKINAAKSLTDKIYISGGLSLLHDNSRYRLNKDEFNQVQLFTRLGFHAKLSKRTDFFSEIGVEHLRTSNIAMWTHSFDSNLIFVDNIQNNINAKIGTITQISDKFQIKTALNYADQQLPMEYNQTNPKGSNIQFFLGIMPDERDLHFNLDMFYKIKKYSQFKFGLGSKQGETVSIGWRYNW